ncbi:Ras-related C3 botulinum toxin substrate 2 [Sarotherodon galilaeus]
MVFEESLQTQAKVNNFDFDERLMAVDNRYVSSLRSNGVLHLSVYIIFGRFPPLTFPSAVGQAARTLGYACLPVCESNVIRPTKKKLSGQLAQ